MITVGMMAKNPAIAFTRRTAVARGSAAHGVGDVPCAAGAGVSGQFLEISKPERIVTSWRWSLGGELLERGAVSRLELQLRGTAAGTELTLIHAGLSNEFSARSHEKGWDGALKKLQREFEKFPWALNGSVPAGHF